MCNQNKLRIWSFCNSTDWHCAICTTYSHLVIQKGCYDIQPGHCNLQTRFNDRVGRGRGGGSVGLSTIQTVKDQTLCPHLQEKIEPKLTLAMMYSYSYLSSTYQYVIIVLQKVMFEPIKHNSTFPGQHS
jgi:hypothetical protein